MKNWLKPLRAAVCGLFIVTSPAYAVEPCGDVIVDEVNLLSAADERRILSAADELAALGATVRVRVTENFGSYTSIGAASDSVCPSWGGDRIVLWVTTGTRDVDLRAGPAWSAQISDRDAAAILDSRMIPALQSGSFASAFIQPINAIVAHLQPAAVVPTPRETSQPVVVTQQPAANKYSAMMVGIVVGGIIFLLVGFFGLRLWTQRNHLRRSAITLGRQGMNRLDQYNKLSAAVTRLLKKEVDKVLSAQAVSVFKARQESLKTNADTVMNDFNGHADPSTLGYNFGAYAALETSLKTSVAAINAVTEKFETLQSDILAAKVQAEAAPERYAEISAGYESALTRVKAVEQQGFVVTGVLQTLETLAATRAEAKRLLDNRAFEGAEKLFVAVLSGANAAADVAEELPVLKAQLQKQLESHTKMFHAMPKKISAAGNIFTQLEATFAPVNYESVTGNGTEAEVRMDDVEDILEEIRVALADQKWEAADSLLVEVGTLLQEVDNLLGAIIDLHKRVNHAMTEAPLELQEARDSIVTARKYLDRYDADTSDLHYQTLEQASRLCDDVAAMLAVAQPDYIRALKLATAADQYADNVLLKGQDEHEQAERMRRRAKRLRTEALESVAETTRYVNTHLGDIGQSARQELASAQAQLQALRNTNDVAAIINLATAIDRLSDSAMSRAKRDFSGAEGVRMAARKAATRKRNEAAAARRRSSSASRTWGSSSGSSSGASSSWRSSASSSSGALRPFSSGASGRSSGASGKW